ncbi:MAG: heme lyase CcmF/NrfE family subunit [Burkholderiales bacterium]|nr:heme lyase CcmF/NrfE family subunit [Burkholderiales bacterium]
MIPELGHMALILALAVALIQGIVPLVGAQKGRTDLMALARPTVLVQTALVIFAFGCLTAAFINNDFSVLYVASNSNSALPVEYRIAGVWGGHEGSLLLWVLMLVVWMLAVARFSRALPLDVVARVLAVMGLVSAGFLLFMLLTSNPFDRLIPAAPDGRDLNPLLQDPGMVFHPPMLYMGYVGFSVAFAFAIAALIDGNLNATWARWTRPWTTAAWIFLTIGIALGSSWAYYELGWGGWWFWDPVENASFMPWLVGTALVHSLAVTEKRGGFKAWTVLLAIMAFSLSLLGTFLVRSGVLSSVHAFATDPRRGLFILAFLVIVVGSSLLLYAWRASQVGLGQRFGLVSKETMLLANNMLLAAACGAVLLGTLYPLFLDAMGMGKISVGPPYFDVVFTALMAPLVFLTAVGPLTRWKGDEVPAMAKRLRVAGVVTVLAAGLTVLIAGRASFGSVLGYLMAYWIIAGVTTDLFARVAPAAKQGRLWTGVRQLGRAQIGMMLAHLGVAAFILGVTVVRTHETERDVKMVPGDTTEVGGYVFKLTALRDAEGPNYRMKRGFVEITRDGKLIATLTPEKRVYKVQQNPMTEAAIDTNLARDLYVSMGEELPDGAWTLRVQYKPMVVWIWLGCFIMSFGGGLAASDKRYRVAKRASEAHGANLVEGAA